MTRRYFEDLAPGQRFGGEQYTVDGDEMLAFARKWDPRPVHVDPAAGEAAGFGGGGINGLKSLEGTFISNCILNARMAVRSIGGQALTP